MQKSIHRDQWSVKYYLVSHGGDYYLSRAFHVFSKLFGCNAAVIQ
jgi:hypothetical protein